MVQKDFRSRKNWMIYHCFYIVTDYYKVPIMPEIGPAQEALNSKSMLDTFRAGFNATEQILLKTLFLK